ncbi:MAG: cytochrome c oxidase assembly protein [Candidatus Dormibacteraeota bacterium]|nr:cytochrome c oxidase assembly protein [Candidatus Dormibacteraeota bacterium]
MWFLRWPLDPAVYVGLAALTVGYMWLARTYGATWRRLVFFYLGVLTIWVALETPLHTLGDSYLQSAHMTQHMLLISFAPPFLLLSLTPEMARRLAAVPGVRAVTEPVPAILLYTVGIILWHIPPVFDATATVDALHVAEHLTFFLIGLLFWWPLITATSTAARWRLGDPQKLVFLFFGMLPMMAIALPLQFATYPLYAHYVAAPRINAFLTPVVDQTIAGALMMFLDMVVLATDGLVVFFRWIHREVEGDYRRAPLGAAGSGTPERQSEQDAEDEAALDAYLRSGPGSS